MYGEFISCSLKALKVDVLQKVTDLQRKVDCDIYYSQDQPCFNDTGTVSQDSEEKIYVKQSQDAKRPNQKGNC